jgi:aspartate dehydrogenase
MIVGILGLGAIGSFLARELSKEESVTEVLGFDIDPKRFLAVVRDASKLHNASADGLMQRADVVVEAASVAAAQHYLPKALAAGKHVVVLSVGALADAEFRRQLVAAAGRRGGALHVPSGAVGGVDALKAARLAGLDSVEIETRKRPESLGQAPGTSGVIFEGTAREAIEKFPANINVAVTLGLAGVGPEKTRVRIVSDPEAPGNVHHVHFRGAFGDVTITLENQPHPENPKTSALAAYSALALVRELGKRMHVGT